MHETPRFGTRLFLLVSMSLLSGATLVSGQTSDVVFREDFDKPEPLGTWQITEGTDAQLTTGYQGSESLLVQQPLDDGPGFATVRIPLSLNKLRGTRVKVEAMVRAREVSSPPDPWNGVKCMLHTVAPDGKKWTQQNNVFGTFDWQPLQFIAHIPLDAVQAWLVLGLEKATGQVWFDDIRITVVGRRRTIPKAPESGVDMLRPYRGHSLARLRGAMIGPRVTEADLRVLGGQWKANHIRWQLIWGGFPNGPADEASVAEYRAWLNSALAHLERLLPVCQELGIKVLVDLHTPPGGRNRQSECRIFKEKHYQEALIDVWRDIARRYRGNRTIWGYDLVNEPLEGVVTEGLMDWHALATHTARIIREIDAEHAIVVEPAPWGSPASLDFFEPIDVPGIVYSVHMYIPHRFTHQGIHGNATGTEYPGEVDGQWYDKNTLREALQPAIDYQRDYGVAIYLGEFSAIRWAPGDSAANYLRDAIEIFEENRWDWAYHAFREWDGWSVEHGPNRDDRKRAKTPTQRQRLLRSWFEKNEKP